MMSPKVSVIYDMDWPMMQLPMCHVTGPSASPADDQDPRYIHGLNVSVTKAVARQVFAELPGEVFNVFWSSCATASSAALSGNEAITAMLSKLASKYNSRDASAHGWLDCTPACQAQVALIYGCPGAYLQRISRGSSDSVDFAQFVHDYAAIHSFDEDAKLSAAVSVPVAELDGGNFGLHPPNSMREC